MRVPDEPALRVLREQTDLVLMSPAGPDLASCPVEVAPHLRLRELGIVPAYAITALDQLAALHRLLDEHGAPHGGHVHCELVLGTPGGLPGTTAGLVAAAGALPAGATWSATGLGGAGLPVMLAALSAGGHLRVGMADTPDYAPGEPARDNAQLVARAAGLARIAQRPPAPIDEARELLGIRS